MIQKRQVLINAIMSLAQIAVISAVYFFLYRFLLKTIGVDQLGVWSLVLAISSAAQIANFGLSGGVVKFVAKYIARGKEETVSGIIQTAALSGAVLTGVVFLAGYPLARWILKVVVEPEVLGSALAILPYAFVSLWIMLISSVFMAGLDGYQRIDLRSMILMGGSVFHFLLCLIWAPSQGIMGVAYARVVQNLLMLAVSWGLLKRHLPILPVVRFRWRKSLFKEIIGYGVNFQLIFIARMLYDPITKALLSRFGGISLVGYYEMASRMVQQFRALIVSANQVIVPTIADLKEKVPEKISSVYLTSYRLLVFLALPLYALLIAGIPLIARIWIGEVEPHFVLFGTLLAVGWFFNTLAAPAFFAYLGIGHLRWNVLAQIAMAVLNVALGFILGTLYAGTGVVSAWTISLALGSSIIYLSYHLRYRIPLTELLPADSRILMAVCFISSSLALWAMYFLRNNAGDVLWDLYIPGMVTGILFILMWFHPMRTRVLQWIKMDLLNREVKKG